MRTAGSKHYETLDSSSRTGAIPSALLALAAPGITGLVACQVPISNGALTGEALPTRLKLLSWGDGNRFIAADGTVSTIKVGALTAAQLPLNQDRFGFDRIALDFNHNSLPGHPNYQADPREVAGYGVPLVIDGDGLYIDQIEYTPAGRKYAPNYADLSPTPRLNDAGEVDFLHSVALCPQGAVKGLSFFSVSLPGNSTETTKTKSMDYKKLLCMLLGCDPNVASDTEIEDGVKALATKLESKPGEAASDVTAMAANVTKLTETVTALSTAVAGLTQRNEQVERDGIIAQAMREGKIIPMSAKELPLDSFRKLVGELPADQVPVERRTPENLQALSTGIGTPGTADDSVRRAMGISEEDWKKYNG